MRLVINKINIVNFKNYANQFFDFHPKVNLVVGDNGMGKTNLLDALYYLCLGKSYFTRSDKNVVNHEEDWFRLEGYFEKDDGREKIEVKYQKGNRKQILVSGKPVKKLSEYIGRFPAVMIAPMDIHILLEASEKRRNFLNNTNIQLDKRYLQHLIGYTRLLNQRNTYLKQCNETGFFDNSLIESYDAGLLAPAEYIHDVRKRSTAYISDLFENFHKQLTSDREKCVVSYKSQLLEEQLKILLSNSMDKDKVLGRTTQGVHKDDLLFHLEGKELKTFASQGQLKSFVLALKLAQFDLIHKSKNELPVFLLDDIFAKLDDNRVLNLLQLLVNERRGQIFISDTSETRMSDMLSAQNIDFKQFHIKEGSLVT